MTTNGVLLAFFSLGALAGVIVKAYRRQNTV